MCICHIVFTHHIHWNFKYHVYMSILCTWKCILKSNAGVRLKILPPLTLIFTVS